MPLTKAKGQKVVVVASLYTRSIALGYKVIATLDNHKIDNAVGSLQAVGTSSGRNALAVEIPSSSGNHKPSSGNALEHFIPNNPPLNLILHLLIKFPE
ncbi:hypothetical protein Tco_0938183 [Tanacetum coccineum]|uniref:Uncharacterized protein n=1 Tax=Tanacetum coccineum TaxID=301880 RepID=A0ABQ5DHE0_9ASTR